MSAISDGTRRATFVEELRKVPAFFRRDLLVMWSYRLAFFTDWGNLLMQVVVFFFVGRIVNPQQLPTYGGTRATYMEFVVIGISVTSFMQISLGRVVTAIRGEQLQGTLEALLLTPTAPTTLQLGSVIYELAYVPLRMLIFLALATSLFGVSFTYGGLLPALAVLLVFIPFVWGIGVMSVAGVLTFRRGIGVVGFGATALTLSSGTYFPISVFPSWLESLARLNPITMAVQSIREALIGGAGWAQTLPATLVLVPIGAVSMAVGIGAFRLALRRERRRGTIGLY